MRPPTRMRVLGVLLGALLALVIAMSGAQPALAGSEPLGPTLRLLDQSSWVPMGLPAEFTVATDSLEDATLALTVHREVRTRDDFLAALSGDVGPALGIREQALAEILDADGSATIAIGTQHPDNPRDNDLVELARSGVYPVRIQLDSDDGDAELITFMIARHVGGDPVPTLPVSIVVPIVSAPLRLPDDTVDVDVADELRPGGRLDRLASELAESSDVPATILAGGETVREWQRLAAEDDRVVPGFEALRAAISLPNREVLAAPHVRLDVPALIEHGLASEVAPQLRAGAADLSDALGVRVDPRLSVVEQADTSTVELLASEAFVDRLVVPASSTSEPGDVARAGRVELEAADRAIDAAVSDDVLRFVTSVPGSTAQQVHRLSALLTIDALSGSSGATLVLPWDWNPDEGYISSLLATVDALGYLDAMTLDDWFTSVPIAADPRDEDEVRQISMREIELGTPSVTARRLAQARSELTSLAALVGEDDPRTRRATDAILRAPSADFAGPNGQDRVEADLDAITRDAETFLDGVRVEEKAVTLTGQRATIPITFRNDTDRPVAVEVTFDSPKLVFPDGERQVIELPVGISTEPVAVEARTSGSFSMTVSMATPDGVFPVGAPARMTIRTTIFGGASGWIAAGAATFLGAWWVTHALRARRRRHEVAAS